MPHDIEVLISLARQASERYLQVPFEVPPGTESLQVELLDTEDVAGLTLDLGCEGPDGWRGWSGGARRWFVIRDDDATPGYLPGPITPGQWNVVLGIHTVPPDPVVCRVRITVPARREIDHGPVAEPVVRGIRGSDRQLPAPEGMTWFAGDLHAHSLHSDGKLSLSELANEAVISGLDYLAVTDHNTVSHHAQLSPVGKRHGVVLLPGQEVTTARGHANVYGDVGFIDFRAPADAWIQESRNRGGFISINHPTSGDCSWLHPLTEKPDGIELYHGTWFANPIDTAPLAWHALRPTGALLGGGDFHSYDTPLRPGMPTTWIAATECSVDALLEGLRAGRTTITAGVTFDDGVGRPDLMGSPILIRIGEELWVSAAQGLVLVDRMGGCRMIEEAEMLVPAPPGDGPYRLQDASRRIWALTA